MPSYSNGDGVHVEPQLGHCQPANLEAEQAWYIKGQPWAQSTSIVHSLFWDRCTACMKPAPSTEVGTAKIATATMATNPAMTCPIVVKSASGNCTELEN